MELVVFKHDFLDNETDIRVAELLVLLRDLFFKGVDFPVVELAGCTTGSLGSGFFLRDAFSKDMIIPVMELVDFATWSLDS